MKITTQHMLASRCGYKPWTGGVSVGAGVVDRVFIDQPAVSRGADPGGRMAA